MFIALLRLLCFFVFFFLGFPFVLRCSLVFLSLFQGILGFSWVFLGSLEFSLAFSWVFCGFFSHLFFGLS